jgi:branched-chain amino acid transport system substrate-binding protein
MPGAESGGNSVIRKTVLIALAVAFGTLLFSAYGTSNSAYGSSSRGSVGGASAPIAATFASSTTCTTPIKIGFIYSQTGPLAATFTNAERAAQARVNLQNASGGVHGCHLTLVPGDDGSSATQAVTTANNLMSQNVAILATTSFLTSAFTNVAHLKGYPVVGADYEGPEWGTQPNTNMFGIYGSSQPSDPEATTASQQLKAQGVTKLALVCNNNAGGTAACAGTKAAAESLGMKVVLNEDSIGLTQATFSTEALNIVNSGANGVWISLSEAQALGVAQALVQQGYKGKLLASTGYGQTLLANKSLSSALNGMYFDLFYAPVELKTSATKTFQSALKKYGKITGVPGFDAYNAYMTADLAIKALQVAPAGASNQQIIKSIRAVTAWNASGLSTSTVDFATDFGKGPFANGANGCMYLVQLKSGKFVAVGTHPVCGKVVNP